MYIETDPSGRSAGKNVRGCAVFDKEHLVLRTLCAFPRRVNDLEGHFRPLVYLAYAVVHVRQ